MSPERKRQRLSPGSNAIPMVSADDTVSGVDAQDLDREPHSKKPAAPNTLFVRQLPLDATTETLTGLFSQAFLLKHATVVIDPTTQKSKRYGFVTFADAQDAEKARQQFDGSLFGKRRIRVEVAQARRRVVEESSVAGARKSRPAPEAIQAKSERRRKGLEERDSTKLIIRNLPWSIQDPVQLSQLFRDYGKIKKTILPPAKSGRSPGFGFVVLQTREKAEEALKGVNGKILEGRTLAVDWTVGKEAWERHKEGVTDVYAEEEAPSDSGSQDGGVELEVDGLQDELGTDRSPDEDDAASFATSSDGEQSQDDSLDEAPQEETGTLFVRNLPFSVEDDLLFDHFTQFGAVRYARVVMDQETERSRGTAFVCFYKKQDAISCLREAPKKAPVPASGKESRTLVKHSLLEDTMADPSGHFTIDGRVLHLSRAVNREEAGRLTVEGQKFRDKRDTDKRRLYLLSEGTITPSSSLYNSLPSSERKLRDDSAKQRRDLVRSNPSLHLSFTRLSIRNIPRYVTSKQLKALAREAIVAFAKEVKAGSRQPLSQEELARDGEAAKIAEKERKAKGKGIVRQAKVVFENKTGSKVTEDTGAGRSRGYGFIEYNTHRLSLMGLRYLNGHLVQRSTDSTDQPQAQVDKPKRLVVEFAIENAQVVMRRREREVRSRNNPQGPEPKQPPQRLADAGRGKRKRDDEAVVSQPSGAANSGSRDGKSLDKSAVRNQIIGRKRAKRRTRKAA